MTSIPLVNRPRATFLSAELGFLGVEMNTRMHQDAEPGADLSHLPSPAASAPAFARLVEDEPGSVLRFEAQRMTAQLEPIS